MKCECFDFDGMCHGKPIYRCNGTRERELCSCEGNKYRCDFYENVRLKGKLEEKNINIKIDENKPFNMMEGLYKIIDRGLKDASVKSIEVVVEDLIQIKINRPKGE